MPLRAVDLFCGIGGMTRALAGLVETVAYCEISEHCQSVVTRQMKDGELPSGPIYGDICKLQGRSLGTIDVVLSSFPCQGLSAFGLRKGLADSRSGLFYEMIRLVDEVKPKLVFLENVPSVLKLAMDAVVDEFHFKRMYELRWTCLKASECGAPHDRDRWFCIAVAPGFAQCWTSLAYERFVWNDEPQRLQGPEAPSATDRLQMLGNSVVPDAVRTAFMYLSGGFRPVDIESAEHSTQEVDEDMLLESIEPEMWPRTGMLSDRGAWVVDRRGLACYEIDLQIVIEGHETRPLKVHRSCTTDIIVGRNVMKKRWATPRYSGGTRASLTLTMRASGDLATQLKFERNTPSEQRAWKVPNPEFVEWMMGLPTGVTVATSLSSP